MEKFDSKDITLLNALQGNARLSNSALAERANLSDTPCLRRIKRLEESGVIVGYHAAINREKVGLNVLVYVFVRLNENSEKAANLFESHVENLAHVLSCSVVSGSYDYLLEVIVEDLPSYEQFVKHRLGDCGVISAIESTIVLKQTFSRNQLPIK
ncbi:Lrp/AsnC family transcriptional regulator [Pseudoalteromonas sp. T1lg65]|uniref:Lrp/AsnC family transcriptional regulator n=1 Tax=Pseudoalteromonas sp. T1lg65 TaxID=2077101 RepID=UPI003F79803F